MQRNGQLGGTNLKGKGGPESESSYDMWNNSDAVPTNVMDRPPTDTEQMGTFLN